MAYSEWEAIMLPIRARYAVAEPEVGEDGEPLEEEPAFVVIDEPFGPLFIPRAARTILKKVVDLGWDVKLLQGTTTLHAPVYMAKDGKPKKDGTQSLRGDLKTAERTKTHLYLSAANIEKKIGFIATWEDGGWAGAIVRDPVGLPVELFADYEPNQYQKDHFGKDKAEYVGAMRSQEYNDVTWFVTKRKFVKPAAEFSEWLNDWLRIINPKKAPKLKPVEQEPDVEHDILAGMEWSPE